MVGSRAESGPGHLVPEPGPPGEPATPPGGAAAPERYLVGSVDPQLLARVARDPRLRVDRELDLQAGPGVLSVQTTAAVAQRLREEYGPGLVVEPDRELRPNR